MRCEQSMWSIAYVFNFYLGDNLHASRYQIIIKAGRSCVHIMGTKPLSFNCNFFVVVKNAVSRPQTVMGQSGQTDLFNFRLEEQSL